MGLYCRVYWFATLDCVNKDCFTNPGMTNQRLSDMGPNGITMGLDWKKICDAYPHSGPIPGPAPDPTPGPTPGTTPGGQCDSWCEADRFNGGIDHREEHCHGSKANACGGCNYCSNSGIRCDSWCEADRYNEGYDHKQEHCFGGQAYHAVVAITAPTATHLTREIVH